MSYSPEQNVYLAKLAEQAERYDEMVEYMKTVAENASMDLSLEERNLLSVAYKNVVGARRASLRIIGSIASKEKEKNQMDKHAAVVTYQAAVEQELNHICEDILNLLDNRLIEKAKDSAEASVFYQKMKADYFRYLAEFAVGEKKQHAKDADASYHTATEKATELAPTHPIRLGLA